MHLYNPITEKYVAVPLASPPAPRVTKTSEGYHLMEVVEYHGREFYYHLYYEDAACTKLIRQDGPSWNDICEALDPDSSTRPWRKDERRPGEYTNWCGM